MLGKWGTSASQSVNHEDIVLSFNVFTHCRLDPLLILILYITSSTMHVSGTAMFAIAMCLISSCDGKIILELL